jgi:hypothetical protein
VVREICQIEMDVKTLFPSFLVSVFPGDSADGAGDFQRALAVLAAIFCEWVEQVRM